MPCQFRFSSAYGAPTSWTTTDQWIIFLNKYYFFFYIGGNVSRIISQNLTPSMTRGIANPASTCFLFLDILFVLCYYWMHQTLTPAVGCLQIHPPNCDQVPPNFIPLPTHFWARLKPSHQNCRISNSHANATDPLDATIHSTTICTLRL